MGIVDLDHSELLHQLVVDLKLFLLELGNHLLSKIYRQDSDDSVEILELLLGVFDGSLNATRVLLALEECADGFLALVDIFQVGLRVRLLRLRLLQHLLKSLLLCNCVDYRLDVVYLALAPVIHMIEGVFLVVNHVIHLFLHLAALGVVEDEEFLLAFGVVRHVQVLILVKQRLQNAVVAYALQSHLAELRQILLHAFHLEEDFLSVDGKLGHHVVKALLVREVIVALLDISDIVKRFNQFTSAGSNESIKHLLEVASAGSREDLHLLGVDEIVVAGTLAEEPLEVEFTLIDKLDFLVADCLLWGQLWNQKSRESLLKPFVQSVEVIEAANAVPRSLLVNTLHMIDDVRAV